jgi:hypothetical protein
MSFKKRFLAKSFQDKLMIEVKKPFLEEEILNL